MLMFFDKYYYLLVVPALLISVLAQINVKSTFGKYSTVRSKANITANKVVQTILSMNNIRGVKLGKIAGNLTDHYDPKSNTIRLSDTVNQETSIAAIGVAAHETGHALQHNEGYLPVKIRGGLVPLANIGSNFGMALAVFGIILGPDFDILTKVGILLFTAAVLFYLVTLPVEFNASRRAVTILDGMAEFSDAEVKAVKKVLTAAALTYVAAALTSIANLARLILLSRRGNRRD